MSAVALRLMGEMYAQGVRVRDREGREYAHWPKTLPALGVPSSSINKVRDDLLALGLLVEHPGTLERNGRFFSTYSAPMEQPAERSALRDVVFPGGSTFACGADARAERSNLELPGAGAELAGFESASSPGADAPAPGASACGEDAPGFAGPLAGERANLEHHHQAAATTTTNKHRPVGNMLPGEGDGRTEEGGATPAATPDNSLISYTEEAVRGMALEGLRLAKVGRPEDTLRNKPLNSVLGSLRMLVEKLQRGEAVEKPGGYVMHFLTTETFDPIPWDGEGLSFLSWWLEPKAAENVVQFPLGGRR